MWDNKLTQLHRIQQLLHPCWRTRWQCSRCHCGWCCHLPRWKTVFRRVVTYSFCFNLFKINVFYDELKLTTVSQKAKISFESLISDIGGTLGVFLGASFLSFMEIFEVIMLVLQHFCKNIIGKSFKKWYWFWM